MPDFQIYNKIPTDLPYVFMGKIPERNYCIFVLVDKHQ